MACEYPDAHSPQELWEVVLAQRRAFRTIPEERLSAEYFSPDPTADDRTYARRAALLEDMHFDRERFHVSADTYRSTDLTHWLALDVATRALADTGVRIADLPRERTAVIVGNSLTGEMSRASLLRLRWPYVKRVLDASLGSRVPAAERAELLREVHRRFVAPFAPINEDSLAGALSNTIAGRICNYHDLGGGGYVIDGACSSSLLAVANACTLLENGDADIALVGGVDISLDPFELVGFAKTHALTSGQMRVYDVASSGFLPGEGCGFVVLANGEQAAALGARVYCLIRGWGIASDGAGGITRPEVRGQERALGRAYARAGFGIGTVALIEGHGTGTPVGDEVEIDALSAVLAGQRAAKPIALGSVKANIGHTKAAAGMAGLIKAVMAVHREILPPTSGTDSPQPKISEAAMRVLDYPELAERGAPLRASVSGLGFGGINVHVVLEGASPTTRTRFTEHELRLARSPQEAELILLSASEPAELREVVRQCTAVAARISDAQLTDLAVTLARRKAERFRLSIVTSTPQHLAEQLHWWLEHEPATVGELRAHGVAAGDAEHRPITGFLFPGQAAPARLRAGRLGRRFAVLGARYAGVPASESVHEAEHTSLAQPAIVRASLSGLELMRMLGISADVAIGHSLGELVALHWAGALEESDLERLVAARAELMGSAPGRGAMASLRAPADTVRPLVAGTPLVLAALNGPEQTVIAGPSDAIDRMLREAAGLGIDATRLPVSHAFHSAQMQQAARALRHELTTTQFRALERTVFSTVTGAKLDPETDIRDLLVDQLTAPVEFASALGAARETELWIEVGPGHMLSDLAATQTEAVCASTDVPGDSITGLLSVVGAAWVRGVASDARALFDDRFSRPLAVDSAPSLIVNPCEAALEPPAPPVASRQEVISTPASGDAAESALDSVRQIVASRAQLPLAAVAPASRLLADLHLNSITVASIAAEAARALGRSAPSAPNRYARKTVRELASALEALPPRTETAPARTVAGIGPWVRAFALTEVTSPAPQWHAEPRPAGVWNVIAPMDHRFAETARRALVASGRSGIAVCLPATCEEAAIPFLVQAARATDGAPANTCFVLIQREGLCNAFARSVQVELGIDTCVLDVPESEDSFETVRNEVAAAHGYVECRYDDTGVRHVPVLRHQRLTGDVAPLDSSDVVLVAGGARGIGAECASALAQATGARLALLGRTPSEHDDVRDQLARLAAQGVEAIYVNADVANRDQLGRAIADIRARLGPITGLVHAAGTNVPIPLRELTERAFDATLGPKVRGLDALLGYLGDDLKLLVAFGSVIARSGMAGEAHYALANDWLSRRVRGFAAAHPSCRSFAADWSVWSGIGMGERLGAVEALMDRGVTPITPELGVAAFMRMLRSTTAITELVLAGRLGGDFAPLILDATRLPLLRFIERPRVHVPGVELIVDMDVDARTDPYLSDHRLDGVALFPAVMALEAIAQTHRGLCDAIPGAFHNLEFARPIEVPEGEAVTLRVAALRSDDDVVRFAVRSSLTDFVVDHVRGEIRPLGTTRESLIADPERRGHGCSVDTLYNRLLFHGPRFRRIREYTHVDPWSCTALLHQQREAERWFGAYRPAELLLGDPALRDCGLHAVQACVPHLRVLPQAVESVAIYDRESRARSVRARERSADAEGFVYDIEFLDDAGAVVERWSNVRYRTLGPSTMTLTGWTPDALAPYIARQLRSLARCDTRVALAVEDPEAAFAAVSDVVVRRVDGAPLVAEGFVTSADTGKWKLAASAPFPIGCDIEPVVSRPTAVWADLLGDSRFGLARAIAHDTGRDLDSVSTSLWAAVEAAQKAGCGGNPDVVFEGVNHDGWMRLVAGGAEVVASSVLVHDSPPSPVVIAFAVVRNDAAVV